MRTPLRLRLLLSAFCFLPSAFLFYPDIRGVFSQSSTPPPNAPAQTQQPPGVSPLGARNDLPNPYLAGVSWGQFPGGRKWGSTAGIAVGPDGNIWAIDRCGAFGSRGTNCAGSPLDPVLEFDPSGKLLKAFGKGLFVSPHKITVDHDGNLDRKSVV